MLPRSTPRIGRRQLDHLLVEAKRGRSARLSH
jgi:hypothetical protein